MSSSSVPKIRIGNNIPCLWEVVNLADVIEEEGSDISLYLTTPDGTEVEITDYEIEDDEVSFTLYGTDCEEWGIGYYRMTLWNNKGTTTQRVVDSTLFVRLVSLSEQSDTGESDIDVGDTITLESGKVYVVTKVIEDYVLEAIGDLDDLTTEDQSSIIAAINEVDANCDANAVSIATNATAIATNATNIATNATNISANEADIDELENNVVEIQSDISDLETTVVSKQDALLYYNEDSDYTAATINAGSNASISAFGSTGYVQLNGTQISQTISSSSNIVFNEDALTITSPSVTINENEVATSSDISTLETSIASKQDALTNYTETANTVSNIIVGNSYVSVNSLFSAVTVIDTENDVATAATASASNAGLSYSTSSDSNTLEVNSEGAFYNDVEIATVDDVSTVSTNLTNLGLEVGDLTDLTTTDQSSIVAAINEVAENSGATQVQSDWDETDTTSKAYILNKPDIDTLETTVASKQDALTYYSEDTTNEIGEITVENATLSVNGDADGTIYLNAPCIYQRTNSGSYIQFTEDTLQFYSESVTINGNEVATTSDISTTAGTLTDLTTTDQSNLVAAINEVDANADSKQDALQYYSEDSSYVAAQINAGSNASISAFGSTGYVQLYGTQISQTISSNSNIVFNEDALTITSPSVTINGNEVATSSDIDGKQDTLTAGDNITIEDNVISADIDLSGYATTSDITGMVTSSTSGLAIEVVSEMPSSPDENTIYIVQ